MSHLIWFLIMLAVAGWDYYQWKTEKKPWSLFWCGFALALSAWDLSNLIKVLK